MKTKLFFLLLILLVCISPTNASIVAQIGDLCYKLDTEKHTATVIYQSISVTGDQADGYCSYNDYVTISRANIPNSVEYDKTSYSVTSIGSYAFFNCKYLVSVTIPNSIVNIAPGAFGQNPRMTSIIVDATNPNYCSEDGVLYAKDKTTLLAYPCYKGKSYSIPYGVVSIERNAFCGCSRLISIELPSSLTSIGNSAFRDCSSLTSIEIPNSVMSIGSYAFRGCSSLTSVHISDIATWSSISFGAENSNPLFVAHNLYLNGKLVTDLVIPAGVTEIGKYAFVDCTTFTSVTIPSSVTNIGYRAFENCNNLKTIYFNGDLAQWCSKAWAPFSIFYDYELYINGERISSLIVPNSVTSICPYAFYNCQNLTSVTLHSNISSIGYGAFEDCGSLKGIYVPCGEKERFKAMYNSNLIQYTPSPYKVTSTVIGNGSVQVTDNTICNDSVKITAKPGNYCHFVQWSDGRTDNPLILPLVGDIDVQATFAENPKITYYCNKEQGYVSGPTTTPTGKAQATITFTANSNYGYHFDKWNDGNTDNPRSVFITQDTTFTAYFAFDKSGTCGNGNALKWTYEDKSKTLTINGSGELNENYTFGLEAPSQMQNLIIGNDVTAIGDNAFKGETTINHLTIGCNVASIGNYAFSECKNFDDITCYAQTVPTITDKTFENIGNKKYIYLFVPEGRQRAYQRDDYWGEFDIQVKEATTTDVTGLTIIPEESTATVAWPSVSGAATYELVIKDEEGKVICTLTFNAQGQLTSIAFNAPSRDGAPQHTQTAGFTFTITGLEAGTEYNLTITAKNASGQEIDKKNSSFHTNWPNGIENLHVDSDKPVKVLVDGHIYILRGEHVYDVQGKMVK